MSYPIFQHIFAYEVYFDSQLAGSQWTAYSSATSDTELTVKLNGEVIATVTYGAGTSTATVSGMPDPITTAVGDVLSVHAPGTPDATLAGITGTLAGWY